MKFGLAFVLCSYIANSCVPPLTYSETFNTEYECLHAGYSHSIVQLEQIGPKDINEHRMFIKFSCFLIEEEKQET